MMAYTKHLVFSMIEFLKDQIASGDLSDDAMESVEVAVQCLETAYGLNAQDRECEARYKIDTPLADIFSTSVDKSTFLDSQMNEKEPTDEERMKAAEWKTKGNEFMKEEKYTDALQCYTEAICLDMKSAVYYCNRAAAYSKLNRHNEAMDDCQRALLIDPSYSKAYARMGVAHTALSEHADAYECYRKACELDPDNSSYKSNLQIAQDTLKQQAIQTGANMAGPGGFGGFDMSHLLNNPGVMNMASQLMGNPQIQQMMSNIMSGNNETASGGAPDIGNFLNVGQQMASQLQVNNPELVEQLRQQFHNQDSPSPDAESKE